MALTLERNSTAPGVAERGRRVFTVCLAKDFAAALAAADARRPAVNLRTGVSFQPGIGPHWQEKVFSAFAAVRVDQAARYLDVAPHIVEAAPNHISSADKRGSAGHYNHAKYNPRSELRARRGNCTC